MKKPVIMTESGCLDINPDKDGFGLLVKPNDHLGWKSAMNKLNEHPEICMKMGSRGHSLITEKYTIPHFNQRITEFVISILNN